MMMNILDQEDMIKGLPDQVLMQEAQMPSGELPQYLVVSEIQRRSDMRKRYKAEQGEMPQATVKEQVMQEGIMGAMPQMPPQMAMAPQMPQRMPQMPPTQMMSEGGEATLLDRYYNLDTDDPRGEGFELDADDDPIANRQGILQGLALLGADQETIDDATRRMVEPPKGLVDIIENVILRHRKIRDRRTEKKANGGAVYKPLDPRTQGQLDVMIDSDQMGYADILSFINQIPGTPEDRASMMEYVRGKTGILERAGYEFDQAVDKFGGRLGSAYDQFMDEGGFSPGIGPRLGSAFDTLTGRESVQKRPKTRLPTEEELRAGFSEEPLQYLTEDDIVKGMVPSPMGMGRNLIMAGGRQLARRFGLPAISSADDFIPQLEFIPMGVSPTQLAGSAATTQLGGPETIDIEAEERRNRPTRRGSTVGANRGTTPAERDQSRRRGDTVGAGVGIAPKPPMADSILADSVPKGGIEEKGGGDEVQATSADRMRELLDRMGRTNRGAALVALGTGIAEGKTMQGGREAAEILSKGQTAQTKLEIDAEQFDQQMDLLEQRVKNAARSGNASVIAALVSSATKQLELLDTIGVRDQPGVADRIDTLRAQIQTLMNTYLPQPAGNPTDPLRLFP